jgi:hypothetical protein
MDTEATRILAATTVVVLISCWPVHAQVAADKSIRNATEVADEYMLRRSIRSFSSDIPLAWTPLGFEEARRYLFDLRLAILKQLEQSDELEALRSYVDLNFPDLRREDVVQFSAAPEGGAVDKRTFDATVERVKSLVNTLRNLSPLAIRLRVTTIPDGATVTVKPLLGSRTRQALSNGDFVNLYRGLYEYRITRSGYVPVEGELDLVDDPRDLLECSIAIATRPGAAVGGCSRLDAATHP